METEVGAGCFLSIGCLQGSVWYLFKFLKPRMEEGRAAKSGLFVYNLFFLANRWAHLDSVVIW